MRVAQSPLDQESVAFIRETSKERWQLPDPDGYYVPEGALDSLKRFYSEGIPTGGFLRAVLSNDLFEAFARADEENTRWLKNICMYVYNEVPSVCYGSAEIIDLWVAAKANAR